MQNALPRGLPLEHLLQVASYQMKSKMHWRDLPITASNHEVPRFHLWPWEGLLRGLMALAKGPSHLAVPSFIFTWLFAACLGVGLLAFEACLPPSLLCNPGEVAFPPCASPSSPAHKGS